MGIYDPSFSSKSKAISGLGKRNWNYTWGANVVQGTAYKDTICIRDIIADKTYGTCVNDVEFVAVTDFYKLHQSGASNG